MAKMVCTEADFIEAWRTSKSLLEVAKRCGYRFGNNHTATTMVADRARRIRARGIDLPPYRRPSPSPDQVKQRNSNYQKSYRLELLEAGLCHRCKAPIEPGITKCRPCADQEVVDRRERRERLRNSGREYCHRCLRPRRGHRSFTFKLCAKCLNGQRALRRRVPSNKNRSVYVLTALRDLSLPTVYAIASEAGVAVRTALRHLKALVTSGMVEKVYVEGDPATHYRIRASAEFAEEASL